jgi:hypothetical protein
MSSLMMLPCVSVNASLALTEPISKPRRYCICPMWFYRFGRAPLILPLQSEIIADFVIWEKTFKSGTAPFTLSSQLVGGERPFPDARVSFRG